MTVYGPHSTCYVPSTLLSASCMLIYLTLTVALRGRYYNRHCPYFTDEETEAQDH